MNQSSTDQILEIIRQHGVLRAGDLKDYNIPTSYLYRLYHRGLLMKEGRGLYSLPDTQITEYHSLAQIARLIPNGVICLLSALEYHQLTTQSPYEVWIAINQKARTPHHIEYPPLHIVYFSGAAFTDGIETYTIENLSVKIYNPAKTVVDCFKYRHKIGLDIAIEGLKDCYTQRKCNMDQLWEYARVCRVTNVIKPYLESIL